MSFSKVLVTGASGFVGKAIILRLLLDKKFIPVAAGRSATSLQGLCSVVPFDLTSGQMMPKLDGIQVVIHAAARVHVMNETATDALTEFRKVNVEGSLKLARYAAESGVKRFIFISSIKVNGESTSLGRPYKPDDCPAPTDPYGISKFEAEEGLKALGHSLGMEIVIIRPPLVYGPGVKANFLSMLSWLNKGVPLPLGAINNQRSIIALGNLVDFIIVCIDHPAASNQVFLVSDGVDLSTTQLLHCLARALGKKARLLPLPVGMLKLVASIFGKKALAQRICESLQVDISKNNELLGWTPPVNMTKAMRQTAAYYLEKQTR